MFGVFTLAMLANESLRLVQHIDPISDAKSAYVVTGDAQQHIAVGCDNTTDRSSLRLVVHFKNYIGDGRPGLLAGGRDVSYRFDKRPPQADRWYSHDQEAMLESEITDSIHFMNEMKESSSVLFAPLTMTPIRSMHHSPMRQQNR